jgi:hypothetical protein
MTCTSHHGNPPVLTKSVLPPNDDNADPTPTMRKLTMVETTGVKMYSAWLPDAAKPAASFSL